MMKMICLMAALSFGLASCATEPPHVAAAAPVKQAASQNKERRVCTVIREAETGSNFGARKVCKKVAASDGTTSP